MFLPLNKHSDLITPMTYLMDLLVINLFTYLIPIDVRSPVLFHTYISVGWVIISIKNEFYKVHRYTKVPTLLIKLATQFFFFFLVLYAFIGFFKQPEMSRRILAYYYASVFMTISFIKLLVYFLLLEYRDRFKGNIRRVVVIGDNKKMNQLIAVFTDRTEYGYEYKKQFRSLEGEQQMEQCLAYLEHENIDEVYCSVNQMTNRQIEQIINYADNHLKTIKFIPDNKNIYTKKLKFEYYDYVPVLSLRDIPIHNPINAFFKRLFDIVFSLLVILLLLSWLTPILALIISLESKGPVFFRQRRNGIDNREFYCYKFRSMTPNENADQNSATKNDMRVTKIGRIIRRTSIDELPQFYNVFFGSMSVVGPRPHMVKHTSEFADRIDKFMVRHFVKPGITGLAQVRGFRGEIETDADIQNRIKFDIFYIENWSMFLDLKIILQTVLNIFQKEEKAY